MGDQRLATPTHENTGHQQSCASEGIKPAICTSEFQIMTDCELLTIVSRVWGAISCATAGVSKKSNTLQTLKSIFLVSLYTSFFLSLLLLWPVGDSCQ